MSSETDVIIIGAGAAGLSAAKELTRLGLSYSLVEGSHRIGGRAYSEEIAPGVWFDLGCSYLHQSETNPFVEIADKLGVILGKDKADIFEESNLGLYNNGTPLGVSERKAYFSYFDNCYQSIMVAADRGEDVAVAELADLDSEFAIMFMHAMAADTPFDIDQVSSMDCAVFGEGGDIPVLDGYGNLVLTWGSDLPVTLNARVNSINWSGQGVSVDTVKGNLRGQAVLATVSTGILASGEIQFTPGLPDWKMDAIMGLPTGTESKICLHFDQDVFGDEGRGYYHTWNDAGEAGGFEASVMGQNTAIAFTGGRHAIWLEKQDAQVAHDYALDRVVEVFGADVRKHVTRSIATAWSTDPWTLGSYSYALPGQAHQRHQLALPLDDRLFFAGEATTITDHSCCHGALRSGIRAAQEIAEVLKL